jgi:Rps23 Pro-64 3,4-dihydroxylase Tpa1-like proline 4-hydroxylase
MFKEIFSKFKKNKEPVYKPSIINLTNNDLANLKYNYFESIYNKETDCIIVNNFISDDELKSFKIEHALNLKQFPFLINKKKIYEDEVGFLFGDTIIDNSDIEAYKKNAFIYNSKTSNTSLLQLTNKFLAFFSNVSNKLPSKVAEFEDGLQYFGHSIRNFNSNGRGIFIHTDLITHQKHSHIKPLLDNLDNETILSFFIMINKPKLGGELKIYDDYYNNLPKKLKLNIDKDYEKIENYINTKPSYNINLEEGDLILFNAGQQWHKVEPILGENDRLTVGGFVGYSKNKDEIIIWS